MTVDASGLYDAVRARAVEIVTEAAEIVADSAREDAPVSEVTETNPTSGTLRDSIAVGPVVETGTAVTFVLDVPVDYAEFTDETDTAPHEIAARNAPLLRFWWADGPAGAGVYYFLRVQHPGTRGQRWFRERNPDRWSRALGQVAR